MNPLRNLGRSRFLFGGLPALALLTISPALQAQVVQFQEGVSPTSAYQAGATEVRLDLPDQNRDGGTGIAVGVQGFVNSTQRGLFSFNLSALPDGATVNNVSFSLTITSPDTGSGATPVPLELHLLTGPFDETTVTWNSQPPNSALLTLISATPNAVTNGQTLTWTSTSAFVAAAQAAADANGTLYFALRLADANEVSQLTRNEFSFNSDDTPTNSSRPLFTVTATVPEPSAVILTAIGVIGFSARRLRAGRGSASASHCKR